MPGDLSIRPDLEKPPHAQNANLGLGYCGDARDVFPHSPSLVLLYSTQDSIHGFQSAGLPQGLGMSWEEAGTQAPRLQGI